MISKDAGPPLVMATPGELPCRAASNLTNRVYHSTLQEQTRVCLAVKLRERGHR